jgi:osmotically inducible lipoprotein OsmB
VKQQQAPNGARPFISSLALRMAAGATVLGLAACSTPPTKQQIGIGTGAVVGGVVGSSVTFGSTAGTAAGAAAGALIGNEIGKSMDKKR